MLRGSHARLVDSNVILGSISNWYSRTIVLWENSLGQVAIC